MGLTLVTAPNEEPITLAEAKAQLSFDDQTAADDLIEAQIAAAREWCEGFTRRSFVTTTWDYTLDAFPIVIRPPRSRLIDVTEITYLDGAGDEQTLSTDVYRVDNATEPARITPDYSEVWPITHPVINAVTVRFTAGYGAAADVPEPIKAAIKMLLTEMFERRGDAIAGTNIMQVPNGIRTMLLPYVVDWF